MNSIYEKLVTIWGRFCAILLLGAFAFCSNAKATEKSKLDPKLLMHRSVNRTCGDALMTQSAHPPSSIIDNEMTLVVLFESVFSNLEIYKPQRCSGNIARFIELAKAKGLDISKLNVLLLGSEINGGFVEAVRVRSDEYELWDHHAILQTQGNLILDFDYSSQPTVETREVYLRKMFSPLQNVHLTAASIPASTYVDNFSSLKWNRHEYFFITPAGDKKDFPIVQLSKIP